MSDETAEGEYSGTLDAEIGYVTEVTYEYHQVVAVLEGAGVELTPREGDPSGEAYA